MDESGKMMLLAILMTVLKYGTTSVCGYRIQGLDSNITVSNSLEIGDVVYALVIDVIETDTGEGERKKRGLDANSEVSEVSEDDIMLLTETSYFGLTFSDENNYHELTVASCLVAGQTKTLEFMFNKTLDVEQACDNATLTIEIEATTPEFDIDTSEIFVDADSCTLGERLKVYPVAFSNDETCLVWSCGVKCLNDEKIFWIDSSTPDIAIYTSSEDIDYNKTYDLLLTCFDAPVPFLSTNQILLQAKFNQSITCTSQGTAAANQLQETTPEGYFDEPANVALVASVSALTAGSALGAGLYIWLPSAVRGRIKQPTKQKVTRSISKEHCDNKTHSVFDSYLQWRQRLQQH